MPDKSPGFADLLAAAQTSPETLTGKDIPDGFGMGAPVGGTKFVDSTKESAAIPGNTVYDYTIGRRVFVVYRPWTDCSRCAEAIARDGAVLPEVGDLSCPHTNVLEYQTIVNKCLAGEFVMGKETEITQKDGTVCVSLQWLIPVVNKKRLKAMKKRLARENGEAPPADDDDDQKEGPAR
jgi:hypothetical protein